MRTRNQNIPACELSQQLIPGRRSRGGVGVEGHRDLTAAFKRGFERMTADRNGRPATLTDCLDWYLSFDHRDNVATSCAMSACVSELARQDKVLCDRVTEGFERLVAVMERGLGASPVKAENRPKALRTRGAR